MFLITLKGGLGSIGYTDLWFDPIKACCRFVMCYTRSGLLDLIKVALVSGAWGLWCLTNVGTRESVEHR